MNMHANATMQPPTRILVPTNFSKESHTALEYAASLGEKIHSEVDLLHVWHSRDLELELLPDAVSYDVCFELPVCWPAVVAPQRIDVLSDFVQTDFGHKMIDFLKELDERELASHGRIALGDPSDPADTIVAVAEDEHYDLIVMSTHGRARLVSHSVAERVLRRAPCPVITLRIPTE